MRLTIQSKPAMTSGLVVTAALEAMARPATTRFFDLGGSVGPSISAETGAMTDIDFSQISALAADLAGARQQIPAPLRAPGNERESGVAARLRKAAEPRMVALAPEASSTSPTRSQQGG